MISNFDDKLIKNLLDEINRLNAQLTDLEIYKDELSEEEILSIKKDTFEQLINNTKILEKMKQGQISTNNSIEQAKLVREQKLQSLLCDNFNIKDLLNTYLAGESNFLRAKLNGVISSYAIKKISIQDYESQVSQLLEALCKVSELNDEEKKLNESLKNKVMNKYEVDKGVSQHKIEKTLLK